MAKYDEREERIQKVSSLDGDGLTTPSRVSAHTGKRQRDRATSQNSAKFWRSVLVDVIILLVLVGIGVGGWLGYLALRDIYAPVYDQKEVSYVLKLVDIDYDRADELLPALPEGDVYYSAKADGVCIGQVSDVIAVPSVTGDGKETMTLYLTVSVTATYHPKDGYYVEDICLLAGEVAVYRTKGLVAEGMILSITDPTTETQTTTAQEGGDETP